MKKLSSTVSPFLLLLIPFFVAVLFMMAGTDIEETHQRIQLQASFIQLPDFSQVKALFRP